MSEDPEKLIEEWTGRDHGRDVLSIVIFLCFLIAAIFIGSLIANYFISTLISPS